MRPLSIVLALTIGLIAAAFWTRPAPDLPPPSGPADAVEVVVLHNGFHTNLAFRRDQALALGGPFAEAVRRLPPSPWVQTGWGDARFYVQTGLDAGRVLDALRAFLNPGNPSVILIEPMRDRPDRLYRDEDQVRLILSRAAFARLGAGLNASIAPGPVPAAPSARGLFFASRDRFHGLNLCNHWTARLLSAAGVPVRPVRAYVSGWLLEDLRSADRTLPPPCGGGSGRGVSEPTFRAWRRHPRPDPSPQGGGGRGCGPGPPAAASLDSRGRPRLKPRA